MIVKVMVGGKIFRQKVIFALHFKLKDRLYIKGNSLPVISISETHISFPLTLYFPVNITDLKTLSLVKEKGGNIIELRTKTGSPLSFKPLHQKGF